jgi:hypothetical protein
VSNPSTSRRHLSDRRRRLSDFCPAEPFTDTLGDSLHGHINCRQRFGARENGQISEVDIDGQARHVADEQIDGRAALKGEAIFLCDEGQNSDQQLSLFAIDLTEGQRDPPAR